ncbi:hypothetical protein NCAS_0D03360 [Naumovozyma castellii]|uniref:K Homology domain-containing protein n=1 Tax=Naumovozyma castellii TaxID=27288 RepID=G0VEC6_NAUCA|nr:hypothetical protein NCAS_0D03360 [Naumovozyma castellii CBS 4309]CCC69917.1 hypothetical protein NCAS_0D03360 [Naumovozyma castellii CBS 4309]
MSAIEGVVSETSNMLKRKKEDGVGEGLEAAIKRVALEDEVKDSESVVIDEVSVSDDSVVSQAEQEIEEKFPEDNVHLRMLCSVKEASLVVGPKGESISKIKKDTSTRINVSENIRGVPERIIYVRGACDNVANAYLNIAKAIRKNEGIIFQGPEEDEKDREEGSQSKSSDELVTIHLLISHHLIGYIIGKHGSRLKEIEQTSSCKLYASPDQLFSSNDRILTITGFPDAIQKATRCIGQTILDCHESTSKKRAIFYQPSIGYSALSNSSSYYGYNNQSQRFYQFNKYNSYRSRRAPRSPPVMMIPTPVQPIQVTNQTLKQPVYTAETVANATSFTPNFVLPNVRIVNTIISQSGNNQDSQLMSVQREIYINEEFVGNIIGREGRNINSIKETTGCSIFIDDPVEGSYERKLVIKGTQMGSQAAIMLISNKIEMDRMNSKRRNNSK